MADKTLNVKIKEAYDTEANQKTNNPVLLKGQLAISSDVGKAKVGNGTSTWQQLSYMNAQNAIKATQDASGNVITTTYATKTELSKKSDSGHTHDDRYYTESEINSKLSGDSKNPISLASKDLNTITAYGWYYGGGGNKCTNGPSGIDAFGLQVVRTASGQIKQILHDNGTGKIYYRFFNSTQSTWKSDYNEDNKPTKSDVGLSNVDNTSDKNKPISSATQTALNNKVDKVSGKGLSTNDFTIEYKTKLDGIETGAQKNTVTGVKGSSESSYRTGNINLTPDNIGALSKAGSIMNRTAQIQWGNSEDQTANRSDQTYPVKLGGLYWNEQSDSIKLYGEETGRDNLDLVLQFGDDNSNKLSIRNAKGSQTAYITANGEIGGSFKGNLTGNVSGNVTGNLSGNASTASKLATVRNIKLTGAVTGNANFDGSSDISIGTSISDRSVMPGKLAIKDFYNYAELNENTAAAYGFSSTVDANGTIYSYTPTRDKFISNYHTCNGGEVFRIKGQVSTNCQGVEGSNVKAYVGTAIGIYCYSKEGTSVNIVYSTRITATSDAPWKDITSKVTLPTNARLFRVFIQTNASNSFSGTIKVRNINVTKVEEEAISAQKWSTARSFTIKDASSTNTGTSASVNGTGNVNLLLPSTIKANLTGHASSDLALSGGTMTGAITLKTGNQQGIKLGSSYLSAANSTNGEQVFQGGHLRFGSSDQDYSKWAGLKYDHASKSISLGLADGTTFAANGSSQSGGTILTPGISSIHIGSKADADTVLHTGNYSSYALPLLGGTMTGTIKVDNTDGIKINSHDKDLKIWEVVGNSGAQDSQYGFYEKYNGSKNGNDNTLELFADNQSGTHQSVRSIKQDGTITWNTKNIYNQQANFTSATFSKAITFANNTQNPIGDDVQIGDFNKSGTLGIKGANGKTTIGLVPQNGDGSNYAAISYDGTSVNINKPTTIGTETENSNNTRIANTQYVDRAIRNIDVGSRNLIKGTTGSTVTTIDFPVSSSSTFKDYSFVTVTECNDNYYTLSFEAKVSATGHPKLESFFYNPNTTVSSTPSQGSGSTGHDGEANQGQLTTEQKKYSVTWHQTAANKVKSVIVARVWNHASTKFTLSLRNVKFESGTKSTDQTPALEDNYGGADYVDGYHASTSATKNTIVTRDNNNYVYLNYINTNIGVDGANSSAGVTSGSKFLYTNSDNQIRKSNKAEYIKALGVLPTTGGTLTGQLKINGSASDKLLMVRGIVGSDGNGNEGELHLNYGVDAPIKIGKEAKTYFDSAGILHGNVSGSLSGNASTATKLGTARTINGTSFDGSANITTSNQGTARNITIVDNSGDHSGAVTSVDGSKAYTLKMPETIKGSFTGNLTGNADTATKATQDASGNIITNTYVKKGSSISAPVIQTSAIGSNNFLLTANGCKLTYNGTATGYLMITPPVHFQNTMMRFKVSIYVDGENSIAEYIISGMSTSMKTQANCGAYSVGKSNYSILPVVFSTNNQPNSKLSVDLMEGTSYLTNDSGIALQTTTIGTKYGTQCYVSIGNANTTWNNPIIVISDIMVNGTKSDFSSWYTGQNIKFTTTQNTDIVKTIDHSRIFSDGIVTDNSITIGNMFNDFSIIAQTKSPSKSEKLSNQGPNDILITAPHSISFSDYQGYDDNYQHPYKGKTAVAINCRTGLVSANKVQSYARSTEEVNSGVQGNKNNIYFYSNNNSTGIYSSGAGNVIYIDNSTNTMNYVGQQNGTTDDHGTENSQDTWIPVYSNGKLQHRVSQNIRMSLSGTTLTITA